MKYELTYLLNPNLDEPESSKEDVVEAIKDQGAELESQSELEKTELGAPIKPKLGEETLEEALVGTIEFQFQPNKVNDLKEKIAQKRDVLRVMLVKKKDTEAEPESEPEPQPQQEDEEKKVELEDIDQKLDEILEE